MAALVTVNAWIHHQHAGEQAVLQPAVMARVGSSCVYWLTGCWKSIIVPDVARRVSTLCWNACRRMGCTRWPEVLQELAGVLCAEPHSGFLQALAASVLGRVCDA